MDDEIVEIPFEKLTPEVIDICSDSDMDMESDANSVDVPWPLWWNNSELAEVSEQASMAQHDKHDYGMIWWQMDHIICQHL